VLPGGLTLTVGYESWLLALPTAAPPSDLPQLPVDDPLPLPCPGSGGAGQRLADQPPSCWTPRRPTSPEPDRWTAHLDAALPWDEQLWLRPRRPGERFQPLGMEGRHARVKDVMISSPAGCRTCARAGPSSPTRSHLLWVAGYHIDHRARVTPATGATIRLTCRRQHRGSGMGIKDRKPTPSRYLYRQRTTRQHDDTTKDQPMLDWLNVTPLDFNVLLLLEREQLGWLPTGTGARPVRWRGAAGQRVRRLVPAQQEPGDRALGR
jgi:hypothetical protein